MGLFFNQYTTRRLKEDLSEVYPEFFDEKKEMDNILSYIVQDEGVRFIAIIDEWDAPIRAKSATEKMKHDYLEFLRGFFKNVSITDKVFAGAYMTGILPIKKDGSQSAISEFREYTILRPFKFASFIGFTEEEVQQICEEKGLDFEEMKSWYDGYRLPGAGEIYNSNSVMQAATSGEFVSYWETSSAAGSLLDYLNMDFDGLGKDVDELLKGNSIPVNTKTFKNDMYELNSRDEVLTLLLHFGYLVMDEEGYAGIPNLEIRLEYENLMRGITHKETMNRLRLSDKFFAAVEEMDEEEVARIIQEIHTSEFSPLHYNKEDSLRATIKLACFTYKDFYIKMQEEGGGNGFADIVFVPKKASKKPLLVIELKRDASPEEAIAQIRRMDYTEPYIHSGYDILLVGLSYNSKDEKKKHSCLIEVY